MRLRDALDDLAVDFGLVEDRAGRYALVAGLIGIASEDDDFDSPGGPLLPTPSGFLGALGRGLLSWPR